MGRGTGARVELAQVLRSARRARGLTQVDLAKTLCFGSHSTISELEHGRRIPHETTLAAYCRALRLDYEALLDLRRKALAEEVPDLLVEYLARAPGGQADLGGEAAGPVGGEFEPGAVRRCDACRKSQAEATAAGPGQARAKAPRAVAPW